MTEARKQDGATCDSDDTSMNEHEMRGAHHNRFINGALQKRDGGFDRLRSYLGVVIPENEDATGMLLHAKGKRGRRNVIKGHQGQARQPREQVSIDCIRDGHRAGLDPNLEAKRANRKATGRRAQVITADELILKRTRLLAEDTML